jgi:thermitase
MPTSTARLSRATAVIAVVVGALALPGTAAAADRLIVGFDSSSTVASQVADLRAAGAAVTADQVRAHDIPAIDGATVVLPEGDGPDVRAELLDDSSVEYVEVDHLAHAAWNPGDPRLGGQWGLSKIGAYGAWDTVTGAGVKVAVVDTGVSYNHPDLIGKVDKGWDFVDSDADPMDVQGHGTHVAGIAAGTAGNNVGGSGVAPSSRILAVRVLGADGSGYYSWIANGITYAADHGAKVINLSLGGDQGSAALENAVNYATAKGAIVTCASGNDGRGSLGYPARYANCLSVGATTQSDARSSFSDWGPGLDVVAPGSDILSSVISGGYEAWSGTSMATPMASGVAALLYSQGLSRAQVMSSLTRGARDLGATGYDKTYGYGRVDAAHAVALGATLPHAPADSTAPVVSALTAGATYSRTSTSTRYKWRTRRITRWRVVGTTEYRGSYSWSEQRATTSRKRIYQYRMRRGLVKRRTVIKKRVAVHKRSTVRLVPLQVAATDNSGVDRVALTVDGHWVAIDFNTSDGMSFAWKCSAGTHTLVAYAYDAHDNAGSRQLQRSFTC